MQFLFDPSEATGPAGDTGSAVHAAAAAFHGGGGVADALAQMQARVGEYPKADLADAAALFLRYAADSRNRDIEFLCIEQPIKFSIEAAPEDPTGARIQVVGRVDQVRLLDGRAKLWDLKTSKFDPDDVRYAAVFQAALYCIGASYLLNREVHPGGLILPRQYRQDGTGPAFRHFAWSFKDIPDILMPIRRAVAAVRAGNLQHVPNKDCRWCHAKTPDLCLPKLQETLALRGSSTNP
jgi:hypothetical protein